MHRTELRVDWRRIVLLILLVLLTIWIFSRFADLRDLAATLSRGHGGWLLVALGIYLLYFVMDAQLYRFGFATVGVASRVLELLPVMFTAYFVNALAPSGGAAGAALFVDDAVQRGESGPRTAVGAVLVLLCDLATLLPFLLFSVVYLHRQGKLFYYDIISSAVFVLVVAILSTGLLLARRRPRLLHRVLSVVERRVNWVGARVGRPGILGQDWAERNAQELEQAAQAIVAEPRSLTLTVGWAFVIHAVNLVGLYVIFRAFGQPVRLGTLVAGFSMGIVFWVVTLVPRGLAAVEGIMTLVYTKLGIPPEQAAAIVLTFRAVMFWLPLLIGFFALRRVRTFRSPGNPGGT
ncbi:MAG: flippase-like domain-containing protein [Anaerolineae bacterium]|nr:flippase-like domain-containing protein [Anaerolineae bacterium]